MNKENLTGDILIVDDQPANLKLMVDSLSESGFRAFVAESGESALEQLEYIKPDLIILDVMMPEMNGFETCKHIKENLKTNEIPIIFMTALDDTSNKVKGFESGAVDYITKPFQYQEVLARVTTHITLKKLQDQWKNTNQLLELKVKKRTQELVNALEKVEELKDQLEAENLYLKQEIKIAPVFEEIISVSKSYKKVLAELSQVAVTDATVLILGETGTGKELLAKAVHQASERKKQALVKVNCAALPENLIESELFGHEKGAFTGAVNRKIGRFELADGGSIFLDEIGELPIALQAKILRVLQEGEFERVGGTKTIKANVRVMAATNRDLEKEIEKGNFREDLYYRLNVFPIQNIPLRERKEDIPILANHFVEKFSKKTSKSPKSISQKTMQKLMSYQWPGNIRELENIIERAVILSRGKSLEVGDWLDTRQINKHKKLLTSAENERKYIEEVLKITKGKISGKNSASEILDLKPTTLRSRMEKLGIPFSRY